MARPLVSDALWEKVEPLIPKRKANPRGGRPPVSDRDALSGIIFVLKTGIQWETLPQEMGCGSGMTCWSPLRDWQEAGVWGELHGILLDDLRGEDKTDFSRAAVDSGSLRAVGGGEKTGPNPADRAKPGSHVITDANGIPLCTIGSLNAPLADFITSFDDYERDMIDVQTSTRRSFCLVNA